MASQTSPKTPKSEAMDTPTPKAPSKSNQTRASSSNVRILEPVEIAAGWPGVPAPGRPAYGGPAGLTPRLPVSRFGGELGPGPSIEGPCALPHTQSDASYHKGSFP